MESIFAIGDRMDAELMRDDMLLRCMYEERPDARRAWSLRVLDFVAEKYAVRMAGSKPMRDTLEYVRAAVAAGAPGSDIVACAIVYAALHLEREIAARMCPADEAHVDRRAFAALVNEELPTITQAFVSPSSPVSLDEFVTEATLAYELHRQPDVPHS